MNPFTALKNLSHFTSLHFFFTYPTNPSLHFTSLFMSTSWKLTFWTTYVHLTSLNFTSLHFLSPSLPLTSFHLQFASSDLNNVTWHEARVLISLPFQITLLRLSLRRPVFDAWPIHVGILVDKVALGEVFLRMLGLSLLTLFSQCYPNFISITKAM